MSEFTDIQNLGWNQDSLGFFGTIAFSLIQGWGLYEQYRKINQERSGKSAPTLLWIFFAAQYLAFGVYGLREGKLAMVLNGLLGLGYFANYWAATNWADSHPRRREHLVFLLMLPWLWWTNAPQLTMGLILIVCTALLLKTPWQIVTEDTIGVVDIRWLLVFTGSMSFWFYYSWRIGDWMIFYMNVVGLPIMLVTISVWCWYWLKERRLSTA